jgi:hypothetical protein
LRDAYGFFLSGNWHFIAGGGGEQVIPAKLGNFGIRRKIEGVRFERRDSTLDQQAG